MKVIFYKSRSKSQPWRWKVVAANGERVASGEGHPTRAKAVRAFAALTVAIIEGIST
jgi:uncharacterized protein YegP (UPF0339 family)